MEDLVADLLRLTVGLVFISEQDAPVEIFEPDKKTVEEILEENGDNKEFISSREFFERLGAEKSWFGPKEKERAKRFRLIGELLQRELKNVRVVKAGRTQKDIYVLGRTATGQYLGIRTRAVET